MTARPIDPYGAEYAYIQVADDIQRRITEGEIELKLPSERSFAEEYEVAYTTVRHAMAVLRERGIIVTVHGREPSSPRASLEARKPRDPAQRAMQPAHPAHDLTLTLLGSANSWQGCQRPGRSFLALSWFAI